MNSSRNTTIGTPGQPWGATEKTAWLNQQTHKRSYDADVLARVHSLRSAMDVVQYGSLDYPSGPYPLFALQSRNWSSERPYFLVTGGVHGYETSGVHGALEFATQHASAYEDRVNLIVVACVSPWAYEVIHRWNIDAIDPNRSFVRDSPAKEVSSLMRYIADLDVPIVGHIDLHETTDSDESVFRPALAARDGLVYQPGEIPDGFYVVGDSENPQPEFQQAIVAAVAKVTHIAPPDQRGEIIGSPVVAPGVINYACRALGLCASLTRATYTSTTEVYPDSPRATSAQCNAAQVAAIRAAIEYVCSKSN